MRLGFVESLSLQSNGIDELFVFGVGELVGVEAREPIVLKGGHKEVPIYAVK